MTLSLVRPFRLVVLGALLTGCAARSPQTEPSAGTATTQGWTTALAQATQEVQAGHHAAADRLLLEFQQTHPAAPEASQAAYYRALFRLDPANSAASTREATAILDGMLATPLVNTAITPRLVDAVVLRRVATALETRPTTVVTTPGAQAPAPARPEDARGKDEEIARLKDELSKANAELERIKRRVATPKP